MLFVSREMEERGRCGEIELCLWRKMWTDSGSGETKRGEMCGKGNRKMK
jgi:hypothetical protein